MRANEKRDFHALKHGEFFSISKHCARSAVDLSSVPLRQPGDDNLGRIDESLVANDSSPGNFVLRII